MAALVAVTLLPAPAFAGAAALTKESVRFADGRTGDGNGTVQPGETVEVFLALRNDGDTAVTGIRVSIDAARADEVEGTRNFPDAAPGETVHAAPFVLRIHDDAPIGGVFPCDPVRIERESPGAAQSPPATEAATVPVAFVRLSFDVRTDQGALTLPGSNTIICGARIVRTSKALAATDDRPLPWLPVAGVLLAAGALAGPPLRKRRVRERRVG